MSSERVDSVSLIIYRPSRSQEPQLLVRWEPNERNPTYRIPHRDLNSGETAIECAQRIGAQALGVDFPEDNFDYQMSTVVTNMGKSIKIRVFAVETTPIIHKIPGSGIWRGWQYAYMPLSSLELVYLHPDIPVSTASLRELVKAPYDR
ncbi:hypothetical protein F4678DRAFT_463785 [Xylaria arbuscula]|nr:hypothetical protein F4678DRAFT_463785 [Xylaria arbuscula]